MNKSSYKKKRDAIIKLCGQIILWLLFETAILGLVGPALISADTNASVVAGILIVIFATAVTVKGIADSVYRYNDK